MIKINSRNISQYRNLGYNIKMESFTDKKSIEVFVKDVSKSSKVKITAICNICKSENNIMIVKYYKNLERSNFYSCFRCKNIKKEITCLEKYGYKSYSQTENYKNKYKETCLEKYGVENPNMSISFREKTKQTCLEKYGYTTALSQPKIIESNRIWMSSDEFKEKSKETIKQKWGVEYYSQTENFRRTIEEKKYLIVKKIKKTFLEKYGVEHYSHTDKWKNDYINNLIEIENKKRNTCLVKYNFDNVSKVSQIYDKIIKTKIKNNQIIPTEHLTDWQKYKREIRKITNRNKKTLYEKWNGLDYYDNELISKYLSYTHTHRFYPTIDHKISIFYGFKNNIDPKIIGSLENLCITKRFLNCIKNKLIEDEFEI